MSQEQTDIAVAGSSEGSPGSVVRIAMVVVAQWRMVAVTIGMAIVLAIILWMVLPKKYSATTVLVPAAGTGTSGGGASVSQLPGGLTGLLGAGDPQQRLISTILRSRTVREAVVAQETDPVRKAQVARLMGKQTTLDRRPDDGSIIITVLAPNPQLAASTANKFPLALNEIAARISTEAASHRDKFLEAQLATARDRLVQSEQKMLAFQQNRGAPEPQAQASRTIEAAAQLQQAINAAELEVGRLRRTSTPDNPSLRAAIADLEARRGQLRQLTAGSAGDPVFVSLKRGPQLRVEEGRLSREAKKDEQIYVSLTSALAQTQIDENNNLPVLTVLDPALPPGGPSGSLLKRLVMAGILGGIAGTALVLFRAYRSSLGSLFT